MAFAALGLAECSEQMSPERHSIYRLEIAMKEERIKKKKTRFDKKIYCGSKAA